MKTKLDKGPDTSAVKFKSKFIKTMVNFDKRESLKNSLIPIPIALSKMSP